SLGQVNGKRVAFEPTLVERGKPHQYRYAAAVLTQVFFFERLDSSSRPHLFHSRCIAITPLRQRQRRPAQSTGGYIRTLVPHHIEEGVISLDNQHIIGIEVRTSDFPNESADDVRIDQTPNLRFSICQSPIESYIFE